MSSQLKQILLKMVRLPLADQRWILRQLSNKQLQTFERWQGLQLLTAAKRYRKLNTKQLVLSDEPPQPLPDCCQQLANKAPLYVAIVLKLGDYPWETLFLQQFDTNNTIKKLLENQVPDIKLPVKQALFSDWESTLSFEEQLGNIHG
jgi:hypothetical protein